MKVPGPANGHPDEPPPILRTWPRLYRFVLCYAFALILLLYLFTRAYQP